MKKIISSLFLLISFNSIVKADSSIDTTITISGIEYFACIGGYTDFKGILTGDLFRIEFSSNGHAKLSCPVSSPKKVFGNSKICFYDGYVTTKEYDKLCKFLLRNDFLQMKDRYTQDMDDVGCNIYVIQYNGLKKTIIDENYNIKILKRLKKRIIKFRDKVKWTPVVNLNNLPK